MPDTRERFERLFHPILMELTRPEDKHAWCIVKALEVIALELSELNVAASQVMEIPDRLSAVIHHLERIDAQTDEVAAPLRNTKSARG